MYLFHILYVFLPGIKGQAGHFVKPWILIKEVERKAESVNMTGMDSQGVTASYMEPSD